MDTPKQDSLPDFKTQPTRFTKSVDRKLQLLRPGGQIGIQTALKLVIKIKIPMIVTSYQNVNINALQSNSENLNSGISHLRGLKNSQLGLRKFTRFTLFP